MTPPPAPTLDLIRESPLRTARRTASAELHGSATPTDVRWLYDHAFLWLRALAMTRREVENHIAKDRKFLATLKPTSGTNPSPEYLVAKAQADSRALGRLHLLEKVDQRAEEVKALVCPEPVGPLMVGDLVDVFLSISAMADEGDLAAAADKSLFWAKKLASRGGS